MAADKVDTFTMDTEKFGRSMNDKDDDLTWQQDTKYDLK